MPPQSKNHEIGRWPEDKATNSYAAFSLVELSIVLVILGLLTGGILGGQSLMRAAELRSVATQFTQYQTAIMTFRDKYFSLPGDMTNATSFWGDRATGTEACADAAITDGSPGTCNGNGDGFISIGREAHLAWQHLANAGLMEGSYTGYSSGGTGCGGLCDSTAGVNVPASKIGQGGYSFVLYGQDPVSEALTQFSNKIGTMYNAIYFGVKLTNYYYRNAIISPEEAWNIDTKMDDGKPQYGKVFTRKDTSCATTTDPATADYDLANSAKSCMLVLDLR